MNGGFFMTIYGTIKAAISVKQAAEHYGLKVNRNGMACCPFHNDRHPSLKLNEDYFFCFGCGAKGDVIDLVARLFNLSSYEAAQKLASDFGLDPKPPTAAAIITTAKIRLHPQGMSVASGSISSRRKSINLWQRSFPLWSIIPDL
jgi:hypothetical protein